MIHGHIQAYCARIMCIPKDISMKLHPYRPSKRSFRYLCHQHACQPRRRHGELLSLRYWHWKLWNWKLTDSGCKQYELVCLYNPYRSNSWFDKTLYIHLFMCIYLIVYDLIPVGVLRSYVYSFFYSRCEGLDWNCMSLCTSILFDHICRWILVGGFNTSEKY